MKKSKTETPIVFPVKLTDRTLISEFTYTLDLATLQNIEEIYDFGLTDGSSLFLQVFDDKHFMLDFLKRENGCWDVMNKTVLMEELTEENLSSSLKNTIEKFESKHEQSKD